MECVKGVGGAVAENMAQGVTVSLMTWPVVRFLRSTFDTIGAAEQVHREFQQRVSERAERDAFIGALTTTSTAALRKCEMEIAAILTLLHEAEEAGLAPVIEIPGGRTSVIVLLLRCIDVIRLRVIDVHQRRHNTALMAARADAARNHQRSRQLTHVLSKVRRSGASAREFDFESV